MGGVDALVEATTRWYLTWEPEGDIEETIAAGRDGFERLAAVLGELGSDERRRRREQTAERLVGAGRARSRWPAPTRCGPSSRYAPDMVVGRGRDRARRSRRSPSVFFAVGAELRLDWMEGELERVPATTRMQRWALQAVREDAAQVRRELAGGVLAESRRPAGRGRRGASSPSAATRVRRLQRRSCARSRARASRTSPGLTLAVRQLRSIVD